MSYRRQARVPRGVRTRFGGPAVSTLPEYGNCSYCGLPLVSRITGEKDACHVLGSRVVFCDNLDCEDHHYENVVDTPAVEPGHLSVTPDGICSECGITSENMEGDGWVTTDRYRTFICPSCQVKGKCSMCGLTLTVEEVHAGSPYVGSFKVGDLIGQCTNPDCDNRGYVGKVNVEVVD